MRRRRFIAGLGSAAAWPLAAWAQQAERVRRVGVVLSGGENDAQLQRAIGTFGQQLVKSGWTDGHNVAIAYRWAGGDANRIRNNVSELVRQAPDVIVAVGSEATRALKQQTSTIPLVFALVTDPVAEGFIASFARPGGNITGFTSEEHSIAGKWLSLLKEIAPSITTVMMLYYSENPNWQGHWETIKAAALVLGVSVSAAPVTNAGEIAQRIESFAQTPHVGMVVVPSGLTTVNRQMIAELAARHRLPAVYAHTYYATSAAWYPKAPMATIYFAVRPNMLIAFCGAQSPPTCRCRRRPSSNLPSTSRPPRRWASACRNRFC